MKKRLRLTHLTRLLAVTLLPCWPSGGVLAQDLTRVRATIDTLTAARFYGRGYVRQGEHQAADYLARRFRAIGLTAFGPDYFQHFALTVNTFPDKITFKANGKALAAGRDYLVEAFSQSGRGRGRVVPLDTAIFASEPARQQWLRTPLARRVVAYHQRDYARLVELPPDLLQHTYAGRATVVIQDNNKLTAGLSSAQLNPPVFVVKAAALPPALRRVRFRVHAQLQVDYPTQNVIGYVRGVAQPDSFVVFSAHYDHLGGLGQAYFPGANDNASGVAMLLELADYFAAHPPPHSVAFVAFGAEEAGLVGSRYYTQHPLFPLAQIKLLVNLDLVGTGDEGLMVVNAPGIPAALARLQAINARHNYFPRLGTRGNAPNSDHYYFVLAGVPATFLYTLGGIKAYHDVDDRAETLPLTRFREVFGLLRELAAE